MIPIQKTTPWPHQEQAYMFAMQRLSCLLALDMGTGKSKVVIDLCQNRQCLRVLILCPKSVVDVWPSEFEKHCKVEYKLIPLGKRSIPGRVDAIQQLMSEAQARTTKRINVVVLNYEAITYKLMKAELQSHWWDMIVLDESHRIKAPGGAISNTCKALRVWSTYRMCLTGTPMPHSPLDLYAQYRFLDPQVFGSSFVQYRATFAIMGGFKNKQVIGWKNKELLEKKLRETAVRIKAEDVLELPETLEVKRFCALNPKAQKLYDALKKEFVAYWESGRMSTDNALTQLLRLQQLANGMITPDNGGDPLRVDDSKMQLLADCLQDIGSPEPIVVFCRFHSDLDAVKDITTKLGRPFCELSGRRNELKTWQELDNTSEFGGQILAVQIQAGGVGIDLTKARYCFYYSLGFSLGDYLQSQKRVHRP